MGHFLAVTAVRAPVAMVSSAIVEYCSLHAVSCTQVAANHPDEKTDALLFSKGDWTVVLWPEYFNVHDFPAARNLSACLNTLTSTIDVYDDVCWCHGLFDHGQLLDRFASAPEVIEVEPAEWSGDAKTVASAFGIAPTDIAPYFDHVATDADLDPDFDLSADFTSTMNLEPRAYPDDEFPLSDFWVFCDFWRRCSISYPDDMSAFLVCLRLGSEFANRLPTND